MVMVYGSFFVTINPLNVYEFDKKKEWKYCSICYEFKYFYPQSS